MRRISHHGSRKLLPRKANGHEATLQYVGAFLTETLRVGPRMPLRFEDWCSD